jgi:hypothetical protein
MKAILAAVLLALLAQNAPQAQQRGFIQGVVTRSGSNEPISGVRIAVGLGHLPPVVSNSPLRYQSLFPVATSVVSAVTDEAGRFSVGNLSPGTYTVVANLDGYWGLVEVDLAVLSTSKVVQLDEQNPQAQVALSLIPGGLITGRVQMPNGDSSANFSVNAYRARYVNGRRVLVSALTQRTNDRGEYRLFSIPPGEYYIGAEWESRSRLAVPATVSTTYYPAVTDARLSQAVKVTPGADIGGIDIAMRSLAPATVSGRLIGADSSPVNGGFTYTVIPKDESALLQNLESALKNSANDTSNGRFELRGVEPGSYRMYVRLIGSTLGGFTEIEVPKDGLKDVVVTILPGVDVRGRLQLNDAALPPVAAAPLSGTIAGTPVTLAAQAPRISLRAIDTTTISRSYQTTIEANGTFVFSSIPPGVYRVQGPLGVDFAPAFAGLPADGYVADIRAQSSVFDSGITINGRAPEELQVTVKTDGATVDGAVINTQNKPIRAAVVLVPEASHRENGLRYRIAQTDADGHFAIANVPPGQYKAFASMAGLYAFGMFRSSSYLKNVEDLGMNVSVSARERRTLQLKAVP